MSNYKPFGGGLWIILLALFGSGAFLGYKYTQTGFAWQGVFALILLVAGCVSAFTMYKAK